MGMGNTNGATEDATKDSTLMIKSMALGSTTGLMADDTRATGSMENNTAKVLSFNQMAL